MSNRSPAPRGFTLVELLIVVAIIAILALIAIPNFALAARRAEVARCSSNLKVICTGLFTYKIDHNRYPLADGEAGTHESQGVTSVGNGPAANGSWDAVPRAMIRLGYLSSEDLLFCPVHKKRHKGERLQKFRYAYNSSANDTGGVQGGANNIDGDSHSIWLARCIYVPVERTFNPGAKDVSYPHGDNNDRENALFNDSRVELRDGRADFLADHP